MSPAQFPKEAPPGRLSPRRPHEGEASRKYSRPDGHEDTMQATVLLIEDEAAIADTLVYVLEAEGFRVLWRRLAREGLACLEEESVDLTVLDVGLPDGNGFDVCRRIRETHRMPVIFLTARKEEVDRIVGLEIGGDDYVTKPFSPREVAARVKAVLRRSQPAAEPPSESHRANGTFFIDEARKSIRFRACWLELTRYEYLILRALASRPGQVFSRAQLMDQAWDESSEPFDRAVDTHIKTLRAKLRAVDPNANAIRTHRGMGYSINPEA